ncbi:MAG: hypothetical protein ACFE8N_12530 [Promethearchaeota archaeon]
MVSRETLYGKGSVEKRSEDGEVYQNALITQDGAHILPSKSISSQYVDPEGNYIEKTLLVDIEGNALPIIRSMFKEPVVLSKTINLEEFFNFQIERTYLVNSEQEEELFDLYLTCEELFHQKKLYRFSYAYYDTSLQRDIILVPKEGHLFALVGEFAEFILIKPNQTLYSDIEEEELEEEIAFEIW